MSAILKNIFVEIDRKTILHDVSLTIEKGSFTAILGPSGSGKSTLLRVLAGLARASTGLADLNDGPGVMVWQSLALFPHLTVYENVAFGLRIRRFPGSERVKQVNAALEMVDLRGFNSRSINTLSGGEKQRVAIARALAVKPRMLLLDEPLASLDVHLRSGLLNMIREIHRQMGVTIVMVTHDQIEALGSADQSIIMKSGRVEQCSSPLELQTMPRTAFVASFVGRKNILRGTLSANEGDFAKFRLTSGLELSARVVNWSGPAIQVGQACSCIVESSKIAFCPPPEGYLGRIESVFCSGVLCAVEISSSSFGPLKVDIYNRTTTAAPKIGDQVNFSWQSDEAYLLPGH